MQSRNRDRHGQQACRHRAGRAGGAGELGAWDSHTHTSIIDTMRKIDRLPSGTAAKNPPADAGDADVGSIPGSGRSPGEGDGNPLQHSCWENSRHRGA